MTINIADKITEYQIDTLQNHPANMALDHMTICGFFSTDSQFAAHAKKLRDRADALEKCGAVAY